MFHCKFLYRPTQIVHLVEHRVAVVQRAHHMFQHVRVTVVQILQPQQRFLVKVVEHV